MNKRYVIKEINSWGEFIKLESAWDHLIQLQSKHALFLSFPIMKHFFKVIYDSYEDIKIKIILINNDKNELKGIIPFTIEKKRFARIIPFYKLGIKDNIIGLFTFLLDPAENISQMMDELFRYLRTHKSKWDILSLHHVPSDMNGIDDFLSLGSKNFNIKINETKTLVVAKPVEFADILSQMNGKKRREMKRKIRRLSEDGDLELVSINDHTKIEQYLPTFFDIENNNWKGKMGTSILKSPYLPFFEQMALYLSERKKFHLYLLKIKKVFVSGIYAVIDNDTLYFVKIGYDENYAKYSPSLVLFYLVFEQLTKQYQIQYIDFFGPIDSYQTIFGKTTRTSYDLTIFNRKLVPSFYHFTLMLFNKIQNYSFGKRVINTLLKIPLLKEKINNIYE